MIGFVTINAGDPINLTLTARPISTDACTLFVNGVALPEPNSLGSGTTVSWAAISYAIDASDVLVIRYTRA
jgi:hypothetical protein